MPRYICETTVAAVLHGETTRMISSDMFYWELSGMPMITYDIKKPSSRLFDMPWVEGRGKRHVTGSKKSVVYKKLFWTSCRTSAPPALGEGIPGWK